MTRGNPQDSAGQFALSLPQTPSEYIDILRFRWYWMLLGIVLGIVGSVIAVRTVPKRYESQTVVLVESDTIPQKFIPRITTGAAHDRLRTIQEEILARPRIERVLDDLNPYPELTDSPRAMVVELVQSRIAIALRGGDAFVVKYTDTDPQRAQQMASRLASLFIEQASGQRAAQALDANLFIEEQLEETRADLERVEARLGDVKIRNMGMLPGQLEANLATLQRLEQERQSIVAEIRASRDKRTLLERQLTLQLQMEEPEAALVPAMTSAVDAGPVEPSTLSQYRSYLAQLRTRYTDEHPEVQSTLARIAKIEKQAAEAANPQPIPMPVDSSDVVAEAGATDTPEPDIAPADVGPALQVLSGSDDVMVNDIRVQIAATVRNIEILESQLVKTQQSMSNYQARVERIPAVEQELVALERDYQLISKYYSELLTRKLEAETAGAIEKQWQEQFSIIDPAQVPDNASYPNVFIFILMGTAMGFGGGVTLAFALEVLDPTVKSLRELESLLPYPVLLSLPQFKQTRSKRRGRRSPLPPTPTGQTETPGKLSAAS